MVPLDSHPLLLALASLESSYGQEPSNWRRCFQRFVVRGGALLQSLDRTKIYKNPIQIMLRDISLDGVGFVCQRPFEVNSKWRVSFLKQDSTIAQQAMVVSHCIPLTPTVYLTGGVFCADLGLLCVLGIDPRAIKDGDGPTNAGNSAYQASDNAV